MITMIILGLMEKMVLIKSSEISGTETDVQRILGLLSFTNPISLQKKSSGTDKKFGLHSKCQPPLQPNDFSALLKKFTIFYRHILLRSKSVCHQINIAKKYFKGLYLIFSIESLMKACLSKLRLVKTQFKIQPGFRCFVKQGAAQFICRGNCRRYKIKKGRNSLNQRSFGCQTQTFYQRFFLS